ncbi:hypothetical protein Taro_036903 [Colocasia esculenta]|uniref:Probable purine permease n=1 Tax=Colocasia esculenta TaxID=4460 RepID=A0A843VYX2_COLES|nr:hypothetical protein [Colocasia esculenta]
MDLHKDGAADAATRTRRWRWWLMVAINIFFLLSGQTVATLLGRLYYNEGGDSKWMATLVQSAGFPILILAYVFFPSPRAPRGGDGAAAAAGPRPSVGVLAFVYVSIGLLVAGDNLMYSYGLLYLPVSTYSLICATQLAFNAVLARLINAQRFTHLVLNSVVLLTFSAALLGIRADSDGASAVPKDKYGLGFVLTLGASATYSLILCLMQLAFQKVLKRETFSVVLEMQVFTSVVAACASVVGLFASGEWRSLGEEMKGYRKGGVSYVMTLVWTAVAWQVASVGVVGLVFEVSSLFSNVISTLALPVVPVFAVAFFGDKMDGEKVMAMLLGIWGFSSYIYQHYLDDRKLKKEARDTSEAPAP